MSTSVSEPFSTAQPPLDAEALRIGHKLREVGRALDARYLDKGELIRLLLVTLVAGEHMLIVGPPGTAKSALVRHLARLIDARYFEYLLTRFSEPNEIFGPIDIKAFREGTYVRRVEAMLPDADLVFLDEIFKSNSAILNALLSILNERRFFTGAASIRVPLSSLYGATNEVPNDDALGAVFDRFLVRASSENLDSFHFHGLVERGLRGEIEALAAQAGEPKPPVRPLITLAEIRALRRGGAAGAAAHYPGRAAYAATAAGAAAAVPRGVPGPLQGALLPDPLRGGDAVRPARRQAAQALRGERPRRRANGRRRRRSLRLAPHLEQRRPDRGL